MVVERSELRPFAEDPDYGAESAPQLGDLLYPVRQRFWLILLVMAACTGLAVGFSSFQTPVYEASMKVLVGQRAGIVEDPSQAQNLQDLAVTVSEAVASRPVVQPVVDDLNLERSPEAVIGDIAVEPIPDSQFIEVSYRDADPERAQRVVNAIGDELSERVSELSPEQFSATNVTVWEEAVAPTAPVSPNVLFNGVLAAVVGGMLGVGLAFLLGYLNDSWRSPEDAERSTGLPTYGVIPEFERAKGRKK